MRQSGFSLLEVLVAISICAIIGLGANQMLRTILDSHEAVSERGQVFRDLVRAERVLARDIEQLVPRPVRDEYGETLPPLLADLGEYDLELTRTGWSNPARLARSELQRVGYRLTEDNELERVFWLVLDRPQDAEPVTQTLLENVEDFRVTLFSRDGNTTEVWPDGEVIGLLPQYVEVVITTEVLGDIRRVYGPASEAQAAIAQGAPGEGQDADEETGASGTGEDEDRQ